MIRITCCAILVLLTAPAAVADPLVDAASNREGVIGAGTHLGLAAAPFDVMTLPEAKGQALVITLDGSHPLGSNASIGVRAPFVIASVAQPAGSHLDEAAVGNPQLRGAYRLLAHRTDTSVVTLVGGLDIGAPLAAHSTTLMPNRALAIANAVEGMGSPDLFTPGVVPLTPSASLRWISMPWRVDGTVRLPLLIRVSEADMPDATTTTNAIGFAGVLGIEGRRQLTRRLALAAAARLTGDLLPVTDHVRSLSRLQDLERLSLAIRIGGRAALMVDLQAAVGGELGGSMFGFGVRSMVSLP
jgi:hypothetical protein